MQYVKMVTRHLASARADEDAKCTAFVDRVVAGETGALEELHDRYAADPHGLAVGGDQRVTDGSGPERASGPTHTNADSEGVRW